MNRGHKTIVAMLAVVAVLLAVNIALHGPRAAEAQEVAGDSEPYVVKWLPSDQGCDWAPDYLRVWSDGQIDRWSKQGGPCEYFYQGLELGPVDHPFPVLDAEVDDHSIVVTFADGRVDLIETARCGRGGRHCTISGDGSAPLCLGDVDRNGETNFTDLLYVLSGWGACE